MRAKPPRWAGRRAGSASGHTLFGGTGWLFADLMVAIAMAFLVATTVGFPPAPHVQTAHHPKPVPTHRSQVPPSSPALNLDYIDIQFKIDPVDLLNGGSTAQSQIQSAISGSSKLASQCTGKLSIGCVGLVLLFGGVPTSNPDYPYAKRLDIAVMKVLQNGLGAQSKLFVGALSRDFYQNGAPTSQFEVNLYVFSTP